MLLLLLSIFNQNLQTATESEEQKTGLSHDKDEKYFPSKNHKRSMEPQPLGKENFYKRRQTKGMLILLLNLKSSQLHDDVNYKSKVQPIFE